MKIYVSQSGIVDPVQQSYSDAQSSLNSAKAQYLRCPSSFQYAGEINELKTELGKYAKEVKYITNALIKTERKYTNLFDDYVTSVDGLTEQVLSTKHALVDSLEDMK